MISRCSAGVSEYISPVPPAATTAQIGCASSFARFSCRPSTSSDKSFLKGVIGKAITPESLLRSSVGSIMNQALSAEDAEVFAEVAEKTDPQRPVRKTSAPSAVKNSSQSHIHGLESGLISHRRDAAVRFELH